MTATVPVIAVTSRCGCRLPRGAGGVLRLLARRASGHALFQLATDLPAAVLARLLGIHITVAVAWQRASAGDWMTYAADVSRRTMAPSPTE